MTQWILASCKDEEEEGMVNCRIGACFLAEAEGMKEAYTEYCLCQERAEQTLERCEADPTLQKVVARGTQTTHGGFS